MNTQTKHNEVIEITANPEKMVGKFLSKPLLRKWNENFVDEDTGDVVPIERSELIFQAGTFLNGDAVAQIMFHLQSDEVSEVEVSNQKREAYFAKDSAIAVWNTVIEIDGKNVKLMLYGNSAEMAIEASRDFIELNYSGMCKTKSVKDFGDYILIDRQLAKEEDQELDPNSKKVYKFEVLIIQDETSFPQRFLVFASDTETGLIHINDWVAENQEKHYSNTDEFRVALETVTTVKCNHILEKDFTEAYL